MTALDDRPTTSQQPDTIPTHFDRSSEVTRIRSMTKARVDALAQAEGRTSVETLDRLIDLGLRDSGLPGLPRPHA